MKMKKIKGLFVSAIVSLTFLTGCNQMVERYLVKWQNYDGSILDVEEYLRGQIPTYKGKEPTKAPDENHNYYFSGWNPEIVPVKESAVYVAQFNSDIRLYNIVWQNYDGSILDQEYYQYGEIPSYKGETPSKVSDSQYSYIFSGWSPTIQNVSADATYVAQYNGALNSYTIIWKNYDGSILDSEVYEYGSIPSYKGEIPYRQSEDEYNCYVFNGWEESIVSVTSDATYTAAYQYRLAYNFKKSSSDCYTIKECYFESQKDILIPETYLDSPITLIESGAFSSCTKAENIVVPTSVTSIGKGAFQGCVNLKSISLPFIGETATTNHYLGHIFGASSYNENNDYVPITLKEVKILYGCTIIANNAFYNCKSLTKIIIPSSVTGIDEAFSNCDAEYYYYGTIDSWLAIPEDSKYYFSIPGVHLFLDEGEETTSVTIPNTITIIPNLAFMCCAFLKTINLHENISSIGFAAFSYCSSLTTIAIPNGITSISQWSFLNCSSLSSVYLPNSVTSIGTDAFSGCSSLKSVLIPSSVTKLDSGAFKDCTSLKTIIVENNSLSIHPSSFKNCALEKVFFNGTYQEFQNTNIKDCLSADIIYFYSETQPTEMGNYWHYVDEIPTIW